MIEGWQKRIDTAQRKTHEVIAGVRYQRVRYGNEVPDARPTCRSCGVRHGQFHVPSCCVEICPACKGQAIICMCEVEA